MSIYGYAIVMHKPVQFESMSEYPDDRDNMWYADISVSPVDIEGNIDHATSKFGVSHTGLWKTETQCHGELLNKSYAMRDAIMAIGKKCWIHEAKKPNYWSSDYYLACYVQRQREKVARKAEAKRLREQAKVLMSQAKELVIA